MAKFSNLKVGQKLSEVQYYNVDKIVGNDVQLTPDGGQSVVFDKNYVEKYLSSAHDSSSTVKLTRTELAELFAQQRNAVFTVSYNKQVKEADVVKEIEDAYQNSTPKELSAKLKKAVKKALEGEERILVGRLLGSKDDFGRFQVIDMNIPADASKSYDVRQRLVDPRTLNWFIVKDVKYEQK